MIYNNIFLLLYFKVMFYNTGQAVLPLTIFPHALH